MPNRRLFVTGVRRQPKFIESFHNPENGCEVVRHGRLEAFGELTQRYVLPAGFSFGMVCVVVQKLARTRRCRGLRPTRLPSGIVSVLGLDVGRTAEGGFARSCLHDDEILQTSELARLPREHSQSPASFPLSANRAIADGGRRDESCSVGQ